MTIFSRCARVLPRSSRGFCQASTPNPLGGGGLPLHQKKQVVKKVSTGKLLMGGLGVGAVAYTGYFLAQGGNISDIGKKMLGDFERFNDSSREWFEEIGERIVPSKPAPWLLDLQTMQFPETIPTLVVDVDRLLCKMEYDRRTGWQVVKRPGADQFFKELMHYYEIVVFSDDVVPVASEVISKWNVPVTGVLHRDFCRKTRHGYVKDVRKLGRDMERVLFLDHDPVAFSTAPENGVHVRPFDGDDSDRELFDLIDFLKAAATSGEDMRQFIKRYGGGDPDIGRRYLIEKKENDARIQQRRSLGKSLFSRSSNFGQNQFQRM